ncbi:hypothetical protein [Streptomyces sp. NPDC046985]|uniref:hypothetical protein n=1 Tax=Streptomyces sp. NPDC046985 TaxID=3155377 RepID=UPI003410EAF0
MRRTTLHPTAVATAAAAAVLLAAGCGAQSDGKSGSGAGSSSASAPAATPAPASPTPTRPASPSSPPSSASGSASASASAAKPSRCTGHIQLGVADSGRTVCLTVGGSLRVDLGGAKDRPWAPVRTSGHVLKGADAGIVILPGDALAAYTAVSPGAAVLTSSRPLCASKPGRVSCMALQAWTVSVRVAARP